MFKKYFFLPIIVALFMGACEPIADFEPVLKIGAGPTISSPANGTAIVLEEANADQVVASFSWTEPEFGFDAAVEYTIEMDAAGAGFADPRSLGSVQGVTKLETLTVGEMNAKLLAKGIPDGVASDIEVRIVAEISPDVDPVVSAPITLSVTPYRAEISYPVLQVPGAYQGWNPGDSSTVVYDRQNNGQYEGYRFFTDPNTEFKYAQNYGWDTNWGDTGADGTLDPGGDNILATDAGLYKLNVNLNSLTHTYVKTDWGLIGDATPGGWDADTDMTYDAATGALTITLNLNTGFIKFRANDGWDLNMGDTDTNGSLEYGGSDIPITEAGNYTVSLLITGPDYTYTVIKN